MPKEGPPYSLSDITAIVGDRLRAEEEQRSLCVSVADTRRRRRWPRRPSLHAQAHPEQFVAGILTAVRLLQPITETDLQAALRCSAALTVNTPQGDRPINGIRWSFGVCYFRVTVRNLAAQGALVEHRRRSGTTYTLPEAPDA
jgi:hypothetical protein